MDTPKWIPERMDDQMVEILRQKSPGEKLRMLDEMWHFARQLVESGIRHQHPDWTDEQVERQVASRMSHGAI